MLFFMISYTIVTTFQNGEYITQEKNISAHFEELKETAKKKNVKVVLQNEVGDKYLLLYTFENKYEDQQLGIVHYKKMTLLPLYELERYGHTEQQSVGSDYLNNGQFIVYGDRVKLNADYYTYRKDDRFKRVNLTEERYFIQIQTYQNRHFPVPSINYYKDNGTIVGSTY